MDMVVVPTGGGSLTNNIRQVGTYRKYGGAWVVTDEHGKDVGYLRTTVLGLEISKGDNTGSDYFWRYWGP